MQETQNVLYGQNDAFELNKLNFGIFLYSEATRLQKNEADVV